MAYPIDTSQQSPNHSERHGAPITMLVLHATVGSYASSLAWLCSPMSQVSTHYLIRKDGYIAQLVPDTLAAWHAGRSQWLSLDSAAIQRQSIGIELENRNDGHDPYPDAQIQAAAWLCGDLIARYGITQPMITRHLDIAQPPGRKTDPAGFPWPAFRNALYAVPAPQYRVIGVPVYEAQSGEGALWGHLRVGEVVAIDKTYDNGLGHLADGRGFVDMDALEAVS